MYETSSGNCLLCVVPGCINCSLSANSCVECEDPLRDPANSCTCRNGYEEIDGLCLL